jgi:hypothetical protein
MLNLSVDNSINDASKLFCLPFSVKKPPKQARQTMSSGKKRRKMQSRKEKSFSVFDALSKSQKSYKQPPQVYESPKSPKRSPKKSKELFSRVRSNYLYQKGRQSHDQLNRRRSKVKSLKDQSEMLECVFRPNLEKSVHSFSTTLDSKPDATPIPTKYEISRGRHGTFENLYKNA